jgi:Uma2 family endonuclease
MSATHPHPPRASSNEVILRMPLELRERLLDLLSAAPDYAPKSPMTFEEFLDWADEDTLAEWVDGEVILLSPAGDKHQDIVDFLVSVLRVFVQVNHLGVIRSAPFQMRLTRSSREPDLLFVAEQKRGRILPTYLDGSADLAVEVLSPESVGRDRGEKFYEYEEAGIPEYWLIDPQTQRAEFYQLDAAARYQLAPVNADGVYASRALPGFWLRVAWLWQDDLPPVEDVLLEVGGEAYARHLIERLRRHGFLPQS